jgi:hypothetical protein
VDAMRPADEVAEEIKSMLPADHEQSLTFGG